MKQAGRDKRDNRNCLISHSAMPRRGRINPRCPCRASRRSLQSVRSNDIMQPEKGWQGIVMKFTRGKGLIAAAAMVVS